MLPEVVGVDGWWITWRIRQMIDDDDDVMLSCDAKKKTSTKIEC